MNSQKCVYCPNSDLSVPLLAPSPDPALGFRIRRAALGLARLALWLSILAVQVSARTPSVSITNTTRGGSTVFYVGDSWTITINGAMANVAVLVCAPLGCTPSVNEGYTNGAGSLTLSGYMSSSDVGTWNQTWSAGSFIATPNPLTFSVYPTSAASCDMWTSGSTSIFTLDYVTTYDGQIWHQARGYTYVNALLDPSGYCVMDSDSWDFGSSMSGQRTILTPVQDQWYVTDNGFRPYYIGDPESYYPYIDATGLGYVAVNVTNGGLFVDYSVIGLLVEFVYSDGW